MYVGVDAGTSMTKAAAFDIDGTMLAVEAEPTRLDNPRDGWYEQDLDDVVGSVVAAIRRLTERVGEPPRAIGITGQGDGVWLYDEAGNAVRPAISWLDARAASVLTRWLSDGTAAEAFGHTGNVVFPGAQAPVLAWLDEHEPRSLDHARTAGYCKDAVFTRFTGNRATDASDASLPFLDPYTRLYAPEVVRLFGLSHRMDLLAPIEEPVPIGALRPEIAEAIGVAPEIPVTAGPFDLPACALGSGVTRTGEGHLTIGTTLACQVLIDDLSVLELATAEPAGLTLATPVPGQWLRAMPAMVGTAALDWTLNVVGASHDDLEGLLAQSPPGARGVRCLPYFSASGERAPFLEPAARARFDGLTLHTDKADLVRATCEAIAYAARHCFEAAALGGEIAACGGGVASETWLQMFADVTNRPVRVAPRPEAGARGAVIAALEVLETPIDQRAWTAPERVVEPSPAAKHHAEGYARYVEDVQRAREVWGAR